MILKNFRVKSDHLFHLFLVMIAVSMIVSFVSVAWANGVRLPGEDVSGQMVGAGTLMHFVDTGLFQWGARIFSGICIFSAAWHFKEMRLGPAVISLLAAVLFGTAPMWVRNIFTIGGGDSIFSKTENVTPSNAVARGSDERGSYA